MRTPLRYITNGCVSVVNLLFGAAFDFALISIFRSHLRHAFATQQYRPVYLRSGRRNRVRY